MGIYFCLEGVEAMVKANELRIGNLLLMTFEGVIEAMTARSIGYINTANNKGHTHPFEPILLTEEILIKAGFEKIDYPNFQLKIGNLKLKCRIQGAINVCYSELEDIYLGDRIKYVHDLQNFYFALRGTELNITLD